MPLHGKFRQNLHFYNRQEDDHGSEIKGFWVLVYDFFAKKGKLWSSVYSLF